MTKVKICGLKTPEAVACAVEAGADYIGLVFAKSKRQVSLNQAKDLVRGIPASVKVVGVFANPSLEELLEITQQVPLDLVQIHGHLPAGLSQNLSVPIIRALAVTKGESIGNQPDVDYLLFDAPQAGSGKTFDWQALDTSQLNQPFFIAGGLNPDNVAQTIAHFQPYAVDVSSGVETNGQKDLKKIRQFIESVKS